MSLSPLTINLSNAVVSRKIRKLYHQVKKKYLTSHKFTKFITSKIPLEKATTKKRWDNLSLLAVDP